MRLIDADELYKRTAEWEEQAQAEVIKNKGCRTVEEWDKYREWTIILNERSSFKYDIADAPTIEAVPLEDYRSMEQTVHKLTQALAEAEPIKHGRWIKRGDNSWECSVCHEISCCNGNYCVDCGAKMDGGENGTN